MGRARARPLERAARLGGRLGGPMWRPPTGSWRQSIWCHASAEPRRRPVARARAKRVGAGPVGFWRVADEQSLPFDYSGPESIGRAHGAHESADSRGARGVAPVWLARESKQNSPRTRRPAALVAPGRADK